MVRRSITEVIYGHIRDSQFNEAIGILKDKLIEFPNSRAANSLLGYCFFRIQDYANAAVYYEWLMCTYPKVYDYGVIYANCLYRIGQIQPAINCYEKLKAKGAPIAKSLLAAYYDQKQFRMCENLLVELLEDDPVRLTMTGCLLYNKGSYSEALASFESALKVSLDEFQILYNIALCKYKIGDNKEAMSLLNRLINNAYQLYPEFNNNPTNFMEESKFSELGSPMSSIKRQDSISSNLDLNFFNLANSVLVEAFNLKAAIYYDGANSLSFFLTSQNSCKTALLQKSKRMLHRLPHRRQQDIDPVTLHNLALLTSDSQLADSIQKLSFLLENPPFPTELYQNLVILFLKNEYFDFGAQFIEENLNQIEENLQPDALDLFQATLKAKYRPDDAYEDLSHLLKVAERKLKSLLNQIQSARANKSENLSNKLLEFELALEGYIPILMQIAKIFWDRDDFKQVERQLRKGTEFCAENSIWQANVAHCFFMQEDRYKESAHYYEALIANQMENIEDDNIEKRMMAPDFDIFADDFLFADAPPNLNMKEQKEQITLENKYLKYLDVTAIILANLCVSYIMSSENERAEEVMKKVEFAEETRKKTAKPNEKYFHLCIINLVIGTLYCSKDNFDFGMSRILKSFEPIEETLGTDTWFYAVKTILYLAENIASQWVVIPDSTVDNITELLWKAIEFGGSIPAYNAQLSNPSQNQLEENYTNPSESTIVTIRDEAQQILALFYEMEP